MPQESWLAVRGGKGWNPATGLMEYGFKSVKVQTVPFSGGITDLYSTCRPPKGSLAFYVLQSGPWFLILDPQAVLWENLSAHRAVSKQVAGMAAVVVAKASSQSMGYGVFVKGRIDRWIFKHGETVAQEYGIPPSWEGEVLSTPAEIGERIRQRLGIWLDKVHEATVLFAPVPVVEKIRRRLFRWPFTGRQENLPRL